MGAHNLIEKKTLNALNVPHHSTGVTQKNKMLLYMKINLVLTQTKKNLMADLDIGGVYISGIDSLLNVTAEWIQERRKVKHCLLTVSENIPTDMKVDIFLF